MHRGCFLWTPTPPPAGRRTPRPGPVLVCVCSSVLARSGGPASRARCGAHRLFLWPLCLSVLLGPLRAGVAPFLVLSLPSPCFLSPPPFFFLSVPPRAALVSFFLWFPAPGALGLGALFSSPPPACGFLFPLFFCAPFVSGFLWFSAPGALGLGAVCCLFCWPPASRSLCALASFVFPAWPLAAPWWLLPRPPPSPPSFSVSRFSSLPLGAPFVVVFSSLSLCAPVVSGFLWFPAPGALGLGAVCCFSFFWPPASRLAVRSRLFCFFLLAVGCSLVVAAPPPPP